MKQTSADLPIIEYVHVPSPDSEARLSRALDLIVRLILADQQDEFPDPQPNETAERVP